MPESPPITEDHEGLILNTQFSFKINKLHWARLQMQALQCNVGHTTLARHWMLKGALAEGIDLNAVF